MIKHLYCKYIKKYRTIQLPEGIYSVGDVIKYDFGKYNSPYAPTKPMQIKGLIKDRAYVSMNIVNPKTVHTITLFLEPDSLIRIGSHMGQKVEIKDE